MVKICTGDRNVLNNYFNNDGNEKFVGVCNIQFLSATIYKKFVKKYHKM